MKIYDIFVLYLYKNISIFLITDSCFTSNIRFLNREIYCLQKRVGCFSSNDLNDFVEQIIETPTSFRFFLSLLSKAFQILIIFWTVIHLSIMDTKVLIN